MWLTLANRWMGYFFLYGVRNPLFLKVDASAHCLVLPRTGQHLWVLTSDRRLRTDSNGQDKGFVAYRWWKVCRSSSPTPNRFLNILAAFFCLWHENYRRRQR